MYSIDFIKLINNLLPWFLRKPVMKAWLETLLVSVADLYDQFTSFIQLKRWEVSITGQVALLEIMLNKEFYDDEEIRKIFIEDNDMEERIYLFNLLEEQEPTYVHNLSEEEDQVYISNSDERESTDFTVWVPDTLVFDTNFLAGLVIKYKMAGPSFDIKTYTE